MENLNAEQIIKALECISRTGDVLCAGCDYRKYDGLACHRIGAKNALALINQLAEENERLNTSCTALIQCCTKLETLYKIECKRVDTVRADTVREMLQRIKDDAASISLLSNPPKFMLEIREDALDQIAKEMEEDNNEKS